MSPIELAEIVHDILPKPVRLTQPMEPGIITDVAPNNIPKNGISTFLSERLPKDYTDLCKQITETEAKLLQMRSTRQYYEALAAAALITLEN